jgi:lysophospholipase L1-like esterase
LAIQDKRFAEAAACVRNLLQIETGNLHLRQQLAHFLLLADDLTSARAEADIILSIQPGQPDALSYVRHIDAREKHIAGWRAAHYRQVDETAALAPRVLFVGDSLTAGWLGAGRPFWDRCFLPLGAGILAIAGDTSGMILWRLENGALDRINPELVILLAGTNDIPSAEPDTVADNVIKLVRVILQRLQPVQVLLLGLLPRDEAPGTILRRKLSEVNAIMAGSANGQSVLFADIGTVLLTPGGSLSSDVSPDALHLSPEGYARLAAPLLSEAMAILGTVTPPG